MARKSRRTRSRSRTSPRRSLSVARSSKPRRRRRSGGGFGKSIAGIATPSLDAVKIGAAMAAGELLVIAVEALTGFDVPDWIPTAAAGLFAYAYWTKDKALMQVAYALAVMEFIQGQDFYADAKAQVAEIGS